MKQTKCGNAFLSHKSPKLLLFLDHMENNKTCLFWHKRYGRMSRKSLPQDIYNQSPAQFQRPSKGTPCIQCPFQIPPPSAPFRGVVMAGYCSSIESTPSSEKLELLRSAPHGTFKIHYQASSDWDFILETKEAIDMDLVIPHYRARQQPVDHRLNMFITAASAPVKLKVCRPVLRCKFYLEIQADVSNVIVWLPSDFKGHIRYPGRASFSAGFVNRIKGNVRMNDDLCDPWDTDEVVIETKGTVMFRMWDVHASAPENCRKETLKRIFGCSRKPEGTRRGINWDFLLED